MDFQVSIKDPDKQLQAETEIYRKIAERMYGLEADEHLTWTKDMDDPMEAGAAKIEALRVFACAAVGDECPVPNQMAKPVPLTQDEKDALAEKIEKDTEGDVKVTSVDGDVATVEPTEGMAAVVTPDGVEIVATGVPENEEIKETAPEPDAKPPGE